MNKRQEREENLKFDKTNESTMLLQPTAATGEWVSPPTTSKTHQNKTKHCILSTDNFKQSSLKLIPKYNKLPNYLFKHILSKYISCYRKKIHQWLTNPKLLQFIRQRAELMNVISQLNIEQDYWTYVLNLGMPAMHWLSTINKNVKQRNYINWDYPRTVDNVLHRKKIVENKLLNAKDDLNVYLQQPVQLFDQLQNNTSIDHAMNIISEALVIMIDNGLHSLHTNFQHKKILLNFDVNDVHLVKSFYDFNPTEEQVYIFFFLYLTSLFFINFRYVLSNRFGEQRRSHVKEQLVK